MNVELEPTFEERMLQEAFAELLVEMRRVSEDAADGMVLNDLEGVILGQGRELLRRVLENQLQAAAERVEKKGARPARVVRRGRETRERDPNKC